VRFEVKDSGKGISPDELSKIFEKYTRGKESFKQAAGLGLGLYVAKIVIKEHQGKIWAESLGEGKGSSFIFTLPIHSHLKTTSQVDFKTINSTPKQKSST
jgi:histidine kinase